MYRIFDSRGFLLYIGSTDNLERRIAQHKRETPWIRKASKYTWEEYETKEGAVSAEYRAISVEGPRYNHNGKLRASSRPEAIKNRVALGDWHGDEYYPTVGNARGRYRKRRGG
jgi:excinuclease UvrABC nuclease subunit